MFLRKQSFQSMGNLIYRYKQRHHLHLKKYCSSFHLTGASLHMIDSPPEDVHHVLCFGGDLHATQPSFAGSCTVSKQDYLGCSWVSLQKPLGPFPLPCLWLGSSSADEVDLGGCCLLWEYRTLSVCTNDGIRVPNGVWARMSYAIAVWAVSTPSLFNCHGLRLASKPVVLGGHPVYLTLLSASFCSCQLVPAPLPGWV